MEVPKDLFRMPNPCVKRFCLTVFFVLAFSASARANFDFNGNCVKAYQNILELKLASAKQLIANEKKMRPNNAIVVLLENYWDYFYLITTDSKLEYEQLHKRKKGRLDVLEEEDKASPYYLYAQAEVNLQWGILSGRFANHFTSAREINRANSLLLQNAKKFPAYLPNQKGLGLISAVLGAMPDGFLKSALATFGIKGNLQQGVAMLKKLVDDLSTSTYEPFYDEVLMYYMMVVTDVEHSANAFANVMRYSERMSNGSLLKTYIKAYVSNKTGHADEVIKLLENRPKGMAYQPFPYLDYLLGLAKLNKLDFSASTDFGAFFTANKGTSFIKDTYLHLGWIALLKGQDSTFATYMAKVKTRGYTYLERDKQALNEANTEKPNSTLLKARLLSDGGFLPVALSVLQNHEVDDFKLQKEKAEFCYRLGRIYGDLHKDELALKHYLKAIDAGKGLKYYFAARSAVLAGKIYIKQKNIAKAKQYLSLALSITGIEYENSIKNEAKQALRNL